MVITELLWRCAVNEILSVIIAMLCVYGFYAVLCEVRNLFRRLSRRTQKKIDKDTEKEYNNTHTN